MSTDTWVVGSLVLGSFVLGSIPFGFLIGKLYGVDVRTQGSGNIGATNTLRLLGRGPGLAVFALDTAKGLAPVVVGSRQHLDSNLIVIVGLAAIIGHIYSPWIRFKGGKGVATSLGVLIGIAPIIAAISFLFFLITYSITKKVSIGSIVAVLSQIALFFIFPGYPDSFRYFSIFIGVFIIFRHKNNISRIIRGEESKTTL